MAKPKGRPANIKKDPVRLLATYLSIAEQSAEKGIGLIHGARELEPRPDDWRATAEKIVAARTKLTADRVLGDS